MKIDFKKVVTCPKCGQDEYYGDLHSRDGQVMCRKCIYALWQEETDKYGRGWTPGSMNNVFPR